MDRTTLIIIVYPQMNKKQWAEEGEGWEVRGRERFPEELVFGEANFISASDKHLEENVIQDLVNISSNDELLNQYILIAYQ